jgi:RNA polymerase sigma factor FliA
MLSRERAPRARSHGVRSGCDLEQPLDLRVGIGIPTWVRSRARHLRTVHAQPATHHTNDLGTTADDAPKLRSNLRAGAASLRASERDAAEARPIERARTSEKKVVAERLWRTYARRRCDATRNRLVEHYQALVREFVRRFERRLPPHVDRGDLGTAGNVGLMAAVEGFDPARGVPFESYCERRVKGALLDELRNLDWLSRPVRARLEQKKRVVERLRADEGREPGDDEVAAALAISPAEYQQFFGAGLLDANLSSTQNEEDGASYPSLEVVADPESDSAREKLTRDELLRLVTQKLSDQEYRLVYLKYWEELSWREIGALMHLSESRVFKIHSRLMERLKDRFRVDVED